jgi:predicted regulator of Ras-like GTPase activity (Roadblock/LC7/MglB family)
MSDLSTGSRSERLDRALSALLAHTPEIEAAAVVSFDGLPMASALPSTMDEDRVAAMSAALLSLGERAAQGLGRGELSQVYIEGETGTVFLVSADNEAVLVAVAAQGAKVGLMLYEVRRAAAAVANALRDHEPAPAVPAQAAAPEPAVEPVAAPPAPEQPFHSVPRPPAAPAAPAPATYVSPLDAAWSSSYSPSGSVMPGATNWS